MPDNMVPPEQSIRIRLDFIKRSCTSGLESLCQSADIQTKLIANTVSYDILRQLEGISADLDRMCISQVKEGKDS